MIVVAKLIVAAIAILAVSGVDAKDREKTKKQHVQDAVARHCGANQATFLIDGLSTSSFKGLLKELPNTAKVTFALGPKEVSNRRFNKLIKYAAEHSHGIAYRFDPDYDNKFRKTDPEKLAKQATRVRKLFDEIYGIKLEKVYLPWTKYHCTQHVEAIEAEGFQTFGHYVYVERNLAHGAKSSVEKDLKKLSKKEKGAIIYHNSHNKSLVSDIEWVLRALDKKDFEIVTLDECLGNSDEDDSSEADVADAILDADLAAVKQAPAEVTTETPVTASTADVKAAPAEGETKEGGNSASSVYISTAIVALSSLLLFL